MAPFEKDVLQYNLPKLINHISANSPEKDIRLAQILIVLNGE